MKRLRKATPIHLACLVICAAALLLSACSPTAQTQEDAFETVERTRPVNPPWQVTPTPNLSLTATVAARVSAIEAYTYYEPFDQNSFEWREGEEDNDFWQGEVRIENSAYIWQITGVKTTFMTWANFKEELALQDFDLAISARRVAGEPHLACFGAFFRMASGGIDDGVYMLSACDNGFYKVLYFDAETRWDTIQDWTETRAIVAEDWNLIEVSARGDEFTILINHQEVLTFTDGRLPSGEIAILVDYYTESPGQIEFDFFALQVP